MIITADSGAFACHRVALRSSAVSCFGLKSGIAPPGQLSRPLTHLEARQQADITRRAANAFLCDAACST